MATEKPSLEDLLLQMIPPQQVMVQTLYDLLLEKGCAVDIKPSTSKFILSFSLGKPRKVVANIVFRKNGPAARIYGEHTTEYAAFLNMLPERMAHSIEKAPVCKKLINPGDCTPNCKGGYDFDLQGTRVQRCKYNAFLFEVDGTTLPFIMEFLKKETEQRQQAMTNQG